MAPDCPTLFVFNYRQLVMEIRQSGRSTTRSESLDDHNGSCYSEIAASVTGEAIFLPNENVDALNFRVATTRKLNEDLYLRRIT
jgi:hypothetical protein